MNGINSENLIIMAFKNKDLILDKKIIKGAIQHRILIIS